MDTRDEAHDAAHRVSPRGRLSRRALSRVGADDAFTLIELLVVVIIIGILAAIAIPVYLGQREKAYDKMAAADARNMAGAQFSVMAGVGHFSNDFDELRDEGGFNRSSDNGKMEHAVCVIGSGNAVDEFIVGARHIGSPDAWVLSSSEGIVKLAGITSLESAINLMHGDCVAGTTIRFSAAGS